MHAWAAFFLCGFVAIGFLLSGCVGSVNGDKSTSTAPQLVVTPNAITFQNVIVGQKNTQTVQISNAGSAELDVSAVTLTGAGFSLGSVAAPLQIAPGANMSFTVSFAPTAATNSAKATISIASNDAASPLSIGVQGTAVSANASWSIAPGSLTFQNVNVQTSQYLDVQLSNSGNTAITVNSVTVTGSGFSSSGLNAGTVISPNQVIHFLAAFHPSTAGNAAGTLNLTGSSSAAPLSVSLAGNAVNATTSAHSVTLTWTETGSGIAGYNVYRGTTSGGPYAGINTSLVPSTSYIDSSVAPGGKYYYVTTAVDSSGNESGFSNEASATIPNP
jgi:hypothetical protein